MSLFGNEQPERYKQGVPKDEIEEQRKKDAEIKKLNDLLEAIKILKQQNIEGNRVVETLEQTIKQKDEKYIFLENSLAAKDFENVTLVNTILPHISSLEKAVEILTNNNSSQKHMIDSLVSLVEEQNEKFDMLEDKFDGKFDAVLVKFDVLEKKSDVMYATVRTIPVEIITEVSKITTTQTDRTISEISLLHLSKEASDEIDAIIRNRLGETADVINTKTVSEITKLNESIINLPTPTIDLSPVLEALDRKTEYLEEGQDDTVNIIKGYIESIPKPQPIDFSKIEEKLEEINDDTQYLTNETDDKIDDIKEVVEALKQGVPIKEPSKQPFKEPLKTPPTIKPEPEISEPVDGNLYPDSSDEDIEEQTSIIEDLKPSNEPSNEPSNTSNNTDIELKPPNKPSKVPTMPSNDDEFKELTQNQQKVAKYVKNNPNKSQKEISEALNMDRGTLSKVLKFLIDEKYITKTEEDTYMWI